MPRLKPTPTTTDRKPTPPAEAQDFELRTDNDAPAGDVTRSLVRLLVALSRDRQEGEPER